MKEPRAPYEKLEAYVRPRLGPRATGGLAITRIPDVERGSADALCCCHLRDAPNAVGVLSAGVEEEARGLQDS